MSDKKLTDNLNTASKRPKERHMIIVQDDSRVQNTAQNINHLLKIKGHDNLKIQSVEYGNKLKDFLKENNDLPHITPDCFILDCGGGGHKLGQFIIKWFDEHRSDAPLPSIHFLSLSTGLSVIEAARLKAMNSRINTGYIAYEELIYTERCLHDHYKNPPETIYFRQTLNDLLDIEISLDVDKGLYQRHQERYESELQKSLLDAYNAGNAPALSTINSWRKYALGLADYLKTELYDVQNTYTETDGRFYEGTGFPAKGTAVFSIEDVRGWPDNTENKPILIMQSYDPDIVPLLDSGKLGGLVVCGPYLAAHLAFLCDANKVSGIFGLIPPEKEGLSNEFNELAESHLSPYFDNLQTEINGTLINAGDKIIINVGENGIAFKPDTIVKIQNSKKSETDIKDVPAADLWRLNNCFQDFFSEHNIKHNNVKANADSSHNPFLKSAAGIGLIRSEQFVNSYEHYAEPLRDVLLSGDCDSYENLASYTKIGYIKFLDNLENNYPVKIRLFDLSPKEIFNKQDLNRFHERYKTLDIHGGEALKTWPRLYKDQVKTIFEAYVSALYWKNQSPPFQIMMPAIRTEQETLDIKSIIDKEAQEQDVSISKYQFGVMIETIDSCNNAAGITKHCDFISFGTNDLTQQVLNIPRDDLRARAKYKEEHGFDPFKKLAPEVLKMIQAVCKIAHDVNPDIEIDICGNQAADFDTALVLFDAGVDNISVAPSQKNLQALPILLNYKKFDAMNHQMDIKKAVRPKQETNTI